MKGDAFVYVAMITMKKTGKRPYGPSVWDLGEPFSSRDSLCELHSVTW